MFPRALALAAALATTALPPGRAEAQATASTRAEAAASYDRGVRAFRERDWATAARWFEQANQLVPSTAALVQAIRAHRNARDLRRSGTVALALEGDATLSPTGQATVQQALASARSRFVRVEVACNAACSLVIDGEPTPYLRVFLEATRSHEVVARFGEVTRSQSVAGPAGSVRPLLFEVPESALAPVEVAAAVEDEVLEDGENPYRISRMRFLSRPRASFFVSAASSSVIWGVTVWSALDTRRSRDALARAREAGAAADELAALEFEHDRDVRRTRGYLGFTGVTVATMGLVAAFTDWTPHGDTEPEVEVSAAGASLGVRHRF